MGQFKQLFASFSLKQKISMAVAAVVVMALLYGVTNWRREQDFKPLYTGVAPEDAAVIVQKIKEAGSEYRLSETGGVISVPSSKVAELRLEMAVAGLPKSGRIGFELFDKTNFGATEFVEHVNYNRALEGELERSIGSLNAVEVARVHLTAAKDSVFVESREPAKASVIVKLKPGATLLPQNVTAIQQLVGSAVEGLNADDVSVVDTRGTLLSRRKISSDSDPSDAVFERRQRIERDLLDKVNGTLEPLLGRDKFRAGVTVDCDLTTSEQSEETYDPTKSVMTNSQKTEEVMTGSAGAGIPGTASNLPRPPARAGGPTNMTTKRTENVSYESSHVVRKTHIPDGGVKRLSVSVLVAQQVRWEGKGNAKKPVPVPAAPETLKAVHDLVAAVTGFTQERGDQITVESLPFEATLEEAPDAGILSTGKPKPLTLKDRLKDPITLIAAGAGAGLIVMIAVFAFMMLKKGKKKAEPKTVTKADLTKAVEDAKANAALEAANAAEQVQAQLAERMEAQHNSDLAAIAALKLPTVTTKKTELLTKEIRETTKKDSNVSAHVLQGWLHE
ncbi:MAG: flagellar M-ring protein FliF [Acidobacteriota bacterium]|nr:flagellar M-ring protein FliF [Acidobacteriota bacterium]